MKRFNIGDRVESTISGCYLGLPGTVKKYYLDIFSEGRMYVILLDIGTTIYLKEQHIKELKESEEK